VKILNQQNKVKPGNKENYQFYHQAFKYNPIKTIIVDREGRIITFNTAKEKSGERLPNIGDIMYKDYGNKHIDNMYEELIRCIHSGQSKIFPAQKYNQQYISITITPFPEGAIITSQDITDSKLAEKALKESDNRYYNLFNRVEVGMYRISESAKILDVNKAFLKILGYPSKKLLIKTNIIDLILNKGIRKEIQTLLKNKSVLNDIEVQIKKFNGSAIWVLLNTYVVHKDDGIFSYYEGAVKDITERKKVQEALKKSEKEKALILSSLLESVIYIDKKFRIIWANDAASKYIGIMPENLVDKFCYEAWHKQNKHCRNCPIIKVFKTQQPQQAEITTPDGKIWSKRGYPVRDENNQIIGAVQVMLDISENKQMEMEKDKIQAQLLQAHKMEAIGTLAGGIAHDFNNLLTAINGCIDLSLIKIDKDNPIYRELKEVHTATSRAADLTRQLLIFSRKHPTQPIPIDLNKAIENLLKMIKRLIGEDIVIVTNLESKLWTIKTDRSAIEQVIMNLTVNARDAMPEGGNLTIKTENIFLDASYCIGLPDARPGQFIRLTISDTGLGMDKEILHRIFDPFYSTKVPGKGTGLGLSMVYGIVKHHDGWINVYSEPGQGSEFKIYLPAIFDKAIEKIVKPISLDSIKGNGERILIVEDESCVREFTQRALHKNGYVVFSASNVSDAIKLFRKEKGDFQLIFTDVVLPDGSGLELINNLHIKNSKLKILLTSGYTDSKSQWSIINKKGYHFIQKPYALTDLLKALKKNFVKTS
jgi:PAS domain S-box-containing protein